MAHGPLCGRRGFIAVESSVNNCFCDCEWQEAVAEDAAVSGLKSTLSETLRKRIRRSKYLIEYIPRDRARKIIADGVSLIKTIPSEEDHRRIAMYIMRVFDGRATRDSFIAYLMRIGGVDYDRAQMIADDQLNKASERFLVEKWKGQGCKLVKWVHKGETNPRVYHLRKWNRVSGKRNGRPNGLNGYVFPIDRPPIIDLKTKERGYPGQMINCRCRLEPVWD